MSAGGVTTVTIMHYHFEDTLTTHDCKQHISHQFDVPAQSEQVEINFRFTPADRHGIKNLLSLTVFDAHGFRGSGHREDASHRACIGTTSATPGYVPGPLPSGVWNVQIGTHLIMPGEDVRYWLDVAITADVAEHTRCSANNRGVEIISEHARCSANNWGVGTSRPRLFAEHRVSEPRWYRGDLHSHTHHSDAGERTVAELIQTARAAGLDFLFLTDHNTIAGLAEIDVLTDDDFLAAGGIEVTTFWGHALCLGTRAWIDWRIRPGTGEVARIAAAAYANDQVFIIAHPFAVGDPTCTGCAWRFGEMMPGNAQLVEIWNGPWNGDSRNEQTLSLWYDWLNQGLHLAATAGTDTHSAKDYAARPGFNVVYAEALSEPAILKALRAGHLYLSAGPQILFQARGEDGQTWKVGDTATSPATLTVNWNNCPPDAQIRVIANGRLLEQWQTGAQGEYAWKLTPDQADWLVVEIRDTHGDMLVVTNPIFLNQL